MDEDQNDEVIEQSSLQDMSNAVADKASQKGQQIASGIAQSAKQNVKDVVTGKKKIVGPEKKARGTMYAKAGQAEEAAGKAADAAGKATQAAGMATHAAGTAARGTAAATKALGTALSAIPYAGAAIKAGMDAAAKTMDEAGKGLQSAGKNIKAQGKKISDVGKKMKDAGEHNIKRGNLLRNKGIDIGGKNSPTGQIPGTPKIPFLPKLPTPGSIGQAMKKKALNMKGLFNKKKWIKIAIIAGIIILALILIFIFIIQSEVEEGKYVEGDLKNVPYVVSKLALSNIDIFPNGAGGYTYGFVDENGKALTMDEVLDNILITLRENGSTSLDQLGSDDKERKEFLKTMIQAEVSTMYPNITQGIDDSSEHLRSTGETYVSDGKDYVVKIDEANAATLLSEEELKTAVTNHAYLSDAAKENLLNEIPNLIELQNKYKVNALFLIAVAEKESSAGTNWDYIDPSTYNWLSVKGDYNGGYTDRTGTVWNKYSSFKEATEMWFQLISGSENYYGAGKYSVRQIAETYCDSAWGDKVCEFMTKYYGYANAKDAKEIEAVASADYSRSPSQSQSIFAQWGWLIQNENINAYYYEKGYSIVNYNSYAVKGYITEDRQHYIVTQNRDGWYIGAGVQVWYQGQYNTFNLELLRNHGVDTSNLQLGSLVNAEATDLVSQEIFAYKKNEIQSQALSMGLNLNDNQIVALVDISYLNGNCRTQLANIAKYGANSEQLANTSGFAPCGENETPNTRAQLVWKLFRYGKYEARAQSIYDPGYFGDLPESAGVTSNTSGPTPNVTVDVVATAGSKDANGVNITDGGNIDFLNYAIDAHKLLREDGFVYNGCGREVPVVRGDRAHYIDCTSYISMALYNYGLEDWAYFPHELTPGTLITYGQEKLEVVYQGNASTTNEIPGLQSGDIVSLSGHGQIFYGYTDSGAAVWLNCGSNGAIAKEEGTDYGWCPSNILYVFRVPAGSGSAYTKKASNQILEGNEDSVDGNIIIKRKTDSGDEYRLTYTDEANFDKLVNSNSEDALKYYTLKKNTSSSSGTAKSGNITLSGSEDKEKIWNFLIDSGFTEEGAAALMGNLEAESGCKSVRVQGDYAHGNAEEYSQNYTDKVDNGEVSRDAFIHNGPGGGGYGLAQWTDPSRKEKLYDYAKEKGGSIGDLQIQLEYLVKELSTVEYYSNIWQMVTTSHDRDAICDLILVRFENPADIAGNRPRRRENAANIYNTYSGTRSAGSSSSSSSSTSSTSSSSGSSTSSSSENGLVKGSYTFSSGGSWEYYIYIPSNPDSNKPLVVYQHGLRTEGSTSVEVLKNGGDYGWAYLTSYENEVFDYYVLEPRIPASTGWFEGDTAKLHELIEHVKSKYGIGTDNVSLWGFSMGSERIEYNIHAYPGYYSSVVILGRNTSYIQGPSSASEFADMPVVVEYGGSDGYSNSGSPAVANQLKNAGANVLVKSQGPYGHGYTLTRAIHDSEIMDFITNGAAGTSSFVSFDNFLFIGDSRYEQIGSQLKELGNNVSACGISGSTPAEWDNIIEKGTGIVHDGRSVTLPETASGISVMLGANSGASQISNIKSVMEKLHKRYPNAKIYFNSVYHLGSNYTYANVDDTNAGYDTVNEEMKNFCSSNSWAIYIDITEGLHDDKGYLKYPDGEGIHLQGEGLSILVENIKNNIKKYGGSSSKSNSSNDANIDSSSTFSLVVAGYEKQTITTSSVYSYQYTKTISKSSGVTGTGGQATATPAGGSSTRSSLKYKMNNADYQAAMKNYTMYFDFLWALLITGSDRSLVMEMAKEAANSTVEITVYSETKTNVNSSSSALSPIVLYSQNDELAFEDHYSGTQTVTTRTDTVTSNPCVTIANVWNMEYENEADNYREFKSKSKEKVREKIDKDDNIMKILRKGDREKTLKREFYLLERMLEDNERVSHILDIFEYYVDNANKKASKVDTSKNGGYIDTSLFDLVNASNAATKRVLLYTSLNISDEEKEMLYKAVEKITSGFEDDNKNTERKKYVTSVILNRALSSKFPNTVTKVLKQRGAFPNFSKDDLEEGSYSDATKSAVDTVIQGGDCAKYSVYFDTPAGAEKHKWDKKYTKTFNDGNDAENSYSYYTTDEIVKELKTFEVTITAGERTGASETARKIVEWAEAQVGKSSFYNSYTQSNTESRMHCPVFVACAYYEAGLEYYCRNAKDMPHPNPIKFNDDGTVDYSEIPVGAIMVSHGSSHNGVVYGHVCLYVGNGYVIEAGGNTVVKSTVDDSYGGKGHCSAPFYGWGFATSDQEDAYNKLVVKYSGGYGSYGEGYTPNDDQTAYDTGVKAFYVNNGTQYNVYIQGWNGVWAGYSYSQGNFESSACGATSCAIVASSFDPSITPLETGKAIYQACGIPFGQYTGVVTNCDSLTRGLKLLGINAEWKWGVTRDQAYQHLLSGQPIILLLHGHRAGGEPYGGHYVTLLGVNEQGQVFVGDPGRNGKYTGFHDYSTIDIPAGAICFVYRN